MRKQRLLSLVALPCLGILAAASVLAQPATAPAPAAELTLGQVVSRLEAAGYTAIGDAERDDGVWEVEAVNAAGERVELDVDLRDARVLRESPDRD